MQSLPLDGLIIVTSPQELATMIVNKTIKMAKLMNIPILGLVENMSAAVCPKCGEIFQVFGPGHTKEMSQRFGIPFLGSLPIDPRLSSSVIGGGWRRIMEAAFYRFHTSTIGGIA